MRSHRYHRYLALTALLALVAAACTSTPPAASTGSSAAATGTPAATSGASASAAASQAAASAAPLAVDPAEKVIQNVEANATINFWTFWLSPTFDQYIKDTITRFEATYPGVTVKWEDHQATFQQDLNNAFAAKIAPDVINLSVSAGWVSDYASKNLLLGLNDTVPKTVQDIYFPGLWNEQLINGQNFQFPWYQGISVELINKKIYETGAGLKAADFPKTIDGLPAICKTILDKTSKVCDIRLTVDDLLAQMTYEGNAKVISADGKSFTFDSPEAVKWLQMYVDMVKAGTVDKTALTSADDRVGLAFFSAGQAPFYQTGPNLIREVKANNATLYGDLAVVQAPIGLSNVSGKGLMSISVKKDTAFPNASIALAQFFTNPRAMVDFAKQVAVYPSSASAYDDPFFASTPSLIEDSARPIAKSIVSTYQDIVPTVPKKADVNAIVLAAVESALFNDVPAQKALSEAVAKANKLLP
ncbi:MAG TPA: extracellular solute-binding protein [Candidatus Limnocylindrales bacterium]|nr:extracellular solute-binding protein [Candidatus Limnocylindrales bacterium]